MRLDMTKVEVAMSEVGFNFTKLAQQSGVSRTTLSYIRNGKSCKPEIGGKIAKALKVSVTDIIVTPTAMGNETN